LESFLFVFIPQSSFRIHHWIFMPIEIEAKMKVTDLGVVRERLKAVGAKPAGSVVELNNFFDTDDRSLLAADQALRLRVKRDVNNGTESYIITYKGPRQHGQLKSREENELTVSNDRDAIALLKSLGYGKVIAFEKRRESWKLSDCSVELDELPYLGSYVEIEGPTEENVLAVRKTLNLGDEPVVRASYIALLTMQREIRFPQRG
jgi:adenylate cyclase class 2